jgi:hypothetical protein
MGTPDGIAGEDWNVVHELSVAIFNATEDEERARARGLLVDHLAILETKYGPRPSILATRADFSEDLDEKERLLHSAYRLADSQRDSRNALYIAHSLAQLYIEDLRNGVEGRQWLERLRELAIEVDDSWFAQEHERLLGIAEP